MILTRRVIPLLGIGFLCFFFLTVRSLSRRWGDFSQVVGMGELAGAKSSPGTTPTSSSTPPLVIWNISNAQPGLVSGGDGVDVGGAAAKDHRSRPFVPGAPKPPGQPYAKMLVVPRTGQEDTSWIATELPDWQSAIYVADDPSAPLHPPKNKGHEVMVYLTYIIDNYENLPDLVAFMHSHQFAWHNDELMGSNAAEMLRRLNPARVMREGFMNLRCVWAPGCPDWMHPGTLKEDSEKQEETMLARSWSEIFPDDPIPKVLAQPCCAQFAVSRDRILSIPRARFVSYRDWLLRTELSDYISGRIWEYLWHVVFTGETIVCPLEHVCYCDGYGLCFGGNDQFAVVKNAQAEKANLEQDLNRWLGTARSIEGQRARGPLGEHSHLSFPEPGRDLSLSAQIQDRARLISAMVEKALARGADPKIRAEELGRPWSEGGGF